MARIVVYGAFTNQYGLIKDMINTFHRKYAARESSDPILRAAVSIEVQGLEPNALDFLKRLLDTDERFANCKFHVTE